LSLTIFDTRVNVVYEPDRDLLYLHAIGIDIKRAYGEESEEGILVFKNARTDRFMGITVMDTCKSTKKRERALKRMGINIDLASLCVANGN
jgi:hypothetical protein